MSRFEANDPLAQIDRLKSILADLRGRQYVGPNGLLGYVTKTADPNDYAFTLTANQTRTFTFTFTHDHALHGSIQQLSVFYSLNDPNVTTGFYPAWLNGPPVFYFIQKMPPTDTQNVWRIHVVNNGASTWQVYFKFILYGTDSGVWTIT